ncbi:IclR family transcriptional regulator [Carnimonas bestiolae]|uniref:IclR family transcriptional regulator n=1 Tax=Carnimonas bestiolae TaxID=3402172 RepID=UPI003F4A89F9
MSSTVSRAIQILELCSALPRTAADIAADLGVHRTTILRTLLTLQDAGMVRQTSPGVFGAGFRLAALARSAMENFDLRAIAHPSLAALSAKLGLTVQFAVPNRDRITYVDKIEPANSIVLNTIIGGDVVINTAGVAKAILAFSPEREKAMILERATFERYTERTITNMTAFDQALEEVRQQGWAYDDGEYDALSNCIAAPVRDHSQRVVGAVSITSFRSQTDIAALKQHLPALIATTTTISNDLGWKPASA